MSWCNSSCLKEYLRKTYKYLNVIYKLKVPQDLRLLRVFSKENTSTTKELLSFHNFYKQTTDSCNHVLVSRCVV